MTQCPDELTLMMLSDGALSSADVEAVQVHLAGCTSCRARAAALGEEAGALRRALGEAFEPGRVPAFEPPLSWVTWALVLALLGLGSVLVRQGPLALLAPLPVSAPDWLGSPLRLDFWSLAELARWLAPWLVERGDILMATVIELILAAAATAAAVWLARRLGARRTASLSLALPLALTLMVPLSAHALDLRRSDSGAILIPAGETVDDTLVATGRQVEIDGDVTGDVFAAGQRVVIRGRVGGGVYVAAETVSIEGTVAGSVIGAGNSVTVSGEVEGTVIGFGETVSATPGRIGRNFVGFGKTVQAGQNTEVVGNAAVFARDALLAGPVGQDVNGFAGRIEIGNRVGGGVLAYTGNLVLLAPARVAGSVTATVPSEDRVTVSPGAEIGGELKITVREQPEPRSRFFDGGAIGLQLLRYAAAFVTGLVVLGLVPGLRRLSLGSAGEGLVAGGVGVLTLVAVPVLALVTGITLIGLPLAVGAFALWLAGLYLAKVLLAHLIGARILGALSERPRHFAAALALGLLVVILAVNVPLLGGLLNFVATALGLGLLVVYLWGIVRGPRDAGPSGAL